MKSNLLCFLAQLLVFLDLISSISRLKLLLVQYVQAYWIRLDWFVQARDAQNVSRSPSSTATDIITHLAVKCVVILLPYRPDLTRWLFTSI